MKKCPTCNQTYSDKTLNYCLEDGTVLISVSSPVTDENIVRPTEQKTEMLSSEQITAYSAGNQKTEELPNEKETVVRSLISNQSQPQVIKQGVSPMFAYLTVGLLALLVLISGVALAVWISSSGNNSATNNEIAKKNANENQLNADSNESNENLANLSVSDSQKSITTNTPKKSATKTPKGDTENNIKPTPTITAPNSPTPSPKPTSTPESDKGKYFVILGSFPQSQRVKAMKRLQAARSKGLPARIVNTSNYPGLRSGLVAVVMGPFSKSNANAALRRARTVSGDAYVKAGS